MVQAPPVTERQARVAAAQHGSLGTYAQAVHHRTYYRYQELWAEALETYNMTVIVCPPGTYKSTTVRDFVEREIGKNPNIRILWLMNAGAQSNKNIMAIQRTLESNNVYVEAFGVREDRDSQWTKEVLFVERTREGADPTIMGTGFNGPYQGLHFDIIIIDDPTDQEDPHSPTTMDMQVEKLRGVIMDRLVDDGTGRIVGILTRWGANDLVPTFADMGFKIIEMPMIGEYPWGPTLDPGRFPMPWCEAKHRKKGDKLWALTYMCNAEAMEGGLIDRDHIGYWDGMLPERPLYFCMAVDPAASLRTYADYSAIGTVGIDLRTRDMYLVDMWSRKVEVPDLEIEIVRRANRVNGLQRVGLETKGFQLSLLQRMKRQYQLPFTEIPYRTRRNVANRVVAIDNDKVGRALYIDQLLSSGRLRLYRDTPVVDGISLETELCSVPHGAHDDRMDVLAMACVLCEGLAVPQLEVSMRAFPLKV